MNKLDQWYHDAAAADRDENEGLRMAERNKNVPFLLEEEVDDPFTNGTEVGEQVTRENVGKLL
jgi:hypothetical protein